MQVYIHIPFCIRKCLYCDFLSAPGTLEFQERYFNALKKQICLWGIREQKRDGGPRTVSTVFIGGGTPSIWDGEWIKELMDMVYAAFDVEETAEITIESNPGTLTQEKLKAYKEAGINRLSIGLQTSDDVLLKALGRIHSWSDFLESYRLAREAGFENINIDLMSGLPGQSLKNYEDTLAKVIELKPEHISAYSLIVEEGTPFAEMTLSLPDEDTERQMYYNTKKILRMAGYERYEISNYSKPGYECRHNLGYWSEAEYIGLGLGAASYDNKIRYSICRDLKEYIDILESSDTDENKICNLMQDVSELTVKEQMEEFCFLGLRKISGISRREFLQLFGRTIDVVYEDVLRKYKLLGLIDSVGDTIRLTDKGLDVSNIVMADFLIEEDV